MALQDSANSTLYSWSWHESSGTTNLLRQLKRDITKLQMFHLFDCSRRWILDFAESIERWTILRRFLPWDARGELDQDTLHGGGGNLWAVFTRGLTAICRRFDTDGLGTGGRSEPQLTERFVKAAMDFIEPLFVEQEAWEDVNLPPLLPMILRRHNWRGRVGEDTGGYAAPAPAAPGPWFGRFRYTVGTGIASTIASVHIHSQAVPESPFADIGALATHFTAMAAHIREFEPQVNTISTVSWLNSSKQYVDIFPPSYRATLTRHQGGSGLSKGFGAWGRHACACVTGTTTTSLGPRASFHSVCVGAAHA